MLHDHARRLSLGARRVIANRRPPRQKIQLEGFDCDEVMPRVRKGRFGLAINKTQTGAMSNLRPPNPVVHALARCSDLLAALMPGGMGGTRKLRTAALGRSRLVKAGRECSCILVGWSEGRTGRIARPALASMNSVTHSESIAFLVVAAFLLWLFLRGRGS